MPDPSFTSIQQHELIHLLQFLSRPSPLSYDNDINLCTRYRPTCEVYPLLIATRSCYINVSGIYFLIYSHLGCYCPVTVHQRPWGRVHTASRFGCMWLHAPPNDPTLCSMDSSEAVMERTHVWMFLVVPFFLFPRVMFMPISFLGRARMTLLN